MVTTIFMITARVPARWNDGRDPAVFWGLESQYHAMRETAEAACKRLQDGGAFGCDRLAEYAIAEVTRADFPFDNLGTAEWRRACHQASVDPETVVGLELAASRAL